MNYRKKLYSNYVSTHTSHLYGKLSLEDIKKQFPVWGYYFGKLLPNDKKAKILEIGCGNGGLVIWLQQLGYGNASGIDISPEQVELAKQLRARNVECADLTAFLKNKENSYDVILARDVIEHFSKDEILDILKLIFISLKKDGLLILQTPNGESPFGSRYRYWDFTHELAFTRSSLNHILKTTGFGETRFYPTGPVPKGLKSVIRFCLWKLIEKILGGYMLIETGYSKGIFTQNIIAVGEKDEV